MPVDRSTSSTSISPGPGTGPNQSLVMCCPTIYEEQGRVLRRGFPFCINTKHETALSLLTGGLLGSS